MRSSILEFTNSKIRFSAVFLLPRNCSVAFKTMGPPADALDLAARSSCSSSSQAISKCSRLIRIWTICPRYCVLKRSTSDWHTFWHSNSSSDCRDHNQSVAGKAAKISLTHRFKGFIDDLRMLEVIIGEKVELVQKIADVYTTERIHLRKGQNTWKSVPISCRNWLLEDLRYRNSSRGFSGVYQLTFTTLSYSSGLCMGIGI